MGSFSFTKADDLTDIGNIQIGSQFKFLIPYEFGGGFIEDEYQDYGYLGHKKDGSPKYDMLELLAFWNADTYYLSDNSDLGIKDWLIYDGDEFPKMKEIDQYTRKNRRWGVNLENKDILYPLKLVSPSYQGTYESCKGRSYDDPNQGCSPLYRVKHNLSTPSLKTYITKWKMDKMLLDRKKFTGDTKGVELLENRIKRHERDIIDYVTSGEFEKILINFNL